MVQKHLTTIGLLIVFFIMVAPLQFGAAQDVAPGEEPSPQWDLGTDLAFGVVSFVDDETGETLTYQQIGLRPEIVIGRFGLGLDLTLNYRFTGGDGSEFEVREEDWVPSGEINFLELYLPKINYIRYGRKGEPFYTQFGSLPSATLGNGFILENYSNELFRPQRRIFGGVLDVDGALLGFPYVGIETLTANVAAWDVMAARLYTRPLADVPVPVLPNMQVGGTLAVDRDPFYHVRISKAPDNPFADVSAPGDPVYVWGIDTRLPILQSEFMSLAAFGDIVWQEDRMGGMVGTGGHLFRFLLYGAQIRLYEDNFVPTYFDRTYDRRRVERYAVYREETDVDGGFGWQGRLGFSLLQESIIFLTTVSGPFESGTGMRPELQAALTLAEGTIPGFSGFSFEGSYEKFNLKDPEDLVSAEDAIIGARFNIRSGPVVITLAYNLMYDPLAEGDPWVVSSGLETAIAF